MPIYTYECACGQVLDVTHGMFEQVELECDNCESMMARKFSAPTIQFKGDGFYSNDKG
jgi:putative FmdB family regulatory protein